MAIVHFLTAALVSSVGIALILLAKKGLQISAKWQYKLDLLFFVLLAIPFIPRRFFAALSFGNWFNAPYAGDRAAAAAAAIAAGETGITYGMGWLQDFAVGVQRSATGYFSGIFVGAWVAGVAVLAAAMLWQSRGLRLIKESVMPVEDEEMLALFRHCKALVGVKSDVLLGSSVMVKAPMAVGFFKTLIILPPGELSPDDARCAMLHELTHCKNMDIKIGVIMSLFQILYWFNPLVYLAFRQMRTDRELACDASVLDMLPGESHMAYGRALLNFAGRRPPPAAFFAGLCGSGPQIARRIRHIASYSAEADFSRVKSACVFILVGMIVLLQIPVLSVLAGNARPDRFNFTAGNVQYADLSHFFGGLEGSFVLYDLTAGMYTVHNRDLSVTRVSPNSTYKIFSALIALETGVLCASDTLREWDGTAHPFESWNRAQNLASAMQYSVNWYFQNMDAQVGMDALYFYLSQLGYGNTDLSGGPDFWVESTLRISPVEQVKLLRDFGNVFGPQHAATVKDALRLLETDGAVLYGKTGTGAVNGRIANGWFVGYVENSNGTFVFATYIRDNAGGSTAAEVTLAILEYKKIFV